MASAIPCRAPQIIKRKLAPCHNPPKSIVVIKFILVTLVFCGFLESMNDKMKIVKAPNEITNGIMLFSIYEKDQINTPIKNKIGKKYPQKVPFRFPPTEI